MVRELLRNIIFVTSFFGIIAWSLASLTIENAILGVFGYASLFASVLSLRWFWIAFSFALLGLALFTWANVVEHFDHGALGICSMEIGLVVNALAVPLIFFGFLQPTGKSSSVVSSELRS